MLQLRLRTFIIRGDCMASLQSSAATAFRRACKKSLPAFHYTGSKTAAYSCCARLSESSHDGKGLA